MQTGEQMASDTPVSEREIAEVYRRHITMVRARARRLLGSAAAAEDVAQDTFMKYLEHRKRGALEQTTATFLYCIATNLSLNRLRDERRQRELLSDQGKPDEGSTPTMDARVDVSRILAQVDDEEAQIAAYYYVDGLEQEEIAQLLDMQRRTVGRRLERFRERALRLLGWTDRKSKPEVSRAIP
jgi:RNA polymerase sigma-70 factor (ECF subfamily)